LSSDFEELRVIPKKFYHYLYNKAYKNEPCVTHPYFSQAKIPRPEPSTTPTITVKYHFLGD
jgi:hypothetical protein